MARLALAVLPLVALAACSMGSDQQEGSQPPPIEVKALQNMQVVDQPLNGYILTEKQTKLLFAAEVRLRVECVRKFGMEWNAPAVNLDAPDVLRYGADAYVKYDAAKAQQYGYHAAPDEKVELEGKKDESAQKLAPEVRTLLSGEGPSSVNGQKVPPGGCVEEARRKLRESIDPKWDENFPNALAINLQGDIDKDPRVVAKQGEWSACMKRSGFDYRTPRDAWADPSWRAATEATPGEKAVAVAEVTCGKEVGLADTVAAVETAYQKRVLNEKSQELNAYAEGKEKILKRVASVLGQ